MWTIFLLLIQKLGSLSKVMKIFSDHNSLLPLVDLPGLVHFKIPLALFFGETRRDDHTGFHDCSLADRDALRSEIEFA